ncbi:MAG TPA: acyl-CoA dehydrogenase family protein [Solirubrobacteraceae bacterium]|jgi:acyl-CoA dehydrogenase|nr:acyl-CoA dehydrogenase family protein [Solirubrobacteraceae bacterium]
MSVLADRDVALIETVRKIAREVAAEHAEEVDRAARFPNETIQALREISALSAFVPTEFGGGGASVSTIARCCLELGRQCGASAMVFAMHQIQVAAIARHIEQGSWFDGYLHELVTDQRLIASATSEVGTGGDMGRSIAAVTPTADGQVGFEKNAPTVSYGVYADDLLTTLRRAPDAEANDQVLALTRRGEHTIEITGTWDVLGMRGTCSAGGIVRATFDPQQVLSNPPFSQVAAESMVPISHILWANVWLGIAEDAFDRARAFVRAASKRSGGGPVPVAQRLSRVMTELGMLRAEVASALNDFNSASEEPGRERLSTLSSALRFNNLKLAASEHASDICKSVLEVNGIMGYKNDTPFSVGRHLRDTLSAPLMIANERIHETNAGLLLIAKEI